MSASERTPAELRPPVGHSGRVFPVGLSLRGRRVLVVGAGLEQARRVLDLVGVGARVRLVAPSRAAELETLTDEELDWQSRSFQLDDLDDAWLVVQVDQDAKLAETVGRAAAERRLFFCAIDQPEWSTYSHVARARAGDLEVAISTSGKAPALASRLKQLFEQLFESAGLAAFVEGAAQLRARTPRAERRKVLGDVMQQVVLEGRLLLPELDADSASDTEDPAD